MNFYTLTLFPEIIYGGLNHSILKKASDNGIINIKCVNIRDFTKNKHKQVDDYPYGGGCGMVMTPEPIYLAWMHTAEMLKSSNFKTLYMTPKGKTFSQKKAYELLNYDSLIILCGHYEGIDERVIEEISPEEISLGDFILTGGELAAMSIIDSVARLVPNVLNNESSPNDESFSSGLLEYPQYTRPPLFMGKPVPDILLSGHHANIKKWRLEKALELTRKKRPDLLLEEYKMEKQRLVFVKPSIEMKDAAMDFRMEFVKAQSKMNGSMGLLKYENYEEWLSDLKLCESGLIEGRMASTTLFAVNIESGKIIGITDLRHKTVLNDLFFKNGHIGGSIRPSERGKGYATEMLRIAVLRIAEFGIKKVLVCCDSYNKASEKAIINAGGVFESEFAEENGNLVKKYWIDAYK